MSVVMAKMRWITMHCADAMNTQLGSECRQQQSECIYNKKKKSPSTATIKGGGGGASSRVAWPNMNCVVPKSR